MNRRSFLRTVGLGVTSFSLPIGGKTLVTGGALAFNSTWPCLHDEVTWLDKDEFSPLLRVIESFPPVENPVMKVKWEG